MTYYTEYENQQYIKLINHEKQQIESKYFKFIVFKVVINKIIIYYLMYYVKLNDWHNVVHNDIPNIQSFIGPNIFEEVQQTGCHTYVETFTEHSTPLQLLIFTIVSMSDKLSYFTQFNIMNMFEIFF